MWNTFSFWFSYEWIVILMSSIWELSMYTTNIQTEKTRMDHLRIIKTWKDGEKRWSQWRWEMRSEKVILEILSSKKNVLPRRLLPDDLCNTTEKDLGLPGQSPNNNTSIILLNKRYSTKHKCILHKAGSHFCGDNVQMKSEHYSGQDNLAETEKKSDKQPSYRQTLEACSFNNQRRSINTIFRMFF